MRTVILASGSEVRAQMLRNAGVSIDTEIAKVDEAATKAAMLSENAPAGDIADALAEMKARYVAKKNPNALVLGADQVLVCGGRIYDKPATLEAARQQLQSLRGKTHELISAAVLFDKGVPVWRHAGRVQLTMRSFSTDFLDTYITQQGNDLLTTVGGYKLEGAGAQLFTQVNGDYFTVLGLPLLEVLGFLRTKGVCQE